MNARKGFTLIEILIVVAIIAILASVVLVGLGPTQQAGRDARRLSDLREVQNALELFYNKCGFYPGTITGGVCGVGNPTTWTNFGTTIDAGGLGVSQIPDDPSTNRSYGYGVLNANASYVLGADLENANNSVFNNYVAPAAGVTWIKDAGTGPAADCGTAIPANGGRTYCISL